MKPVYPSFTLLSAVLAPFLAPFLGLSAPALAFTITPNNDSTQLLNAFFGDTTGLSNFTTTTSGNASAFGTFTGDPFGLGSGIVLSTGRVVDLAGINTADGGFSPGTSVPLTFTKLAGLTGGSPASTAIYRADLSGLGFDLRSLSISDGGVVGGAGGRFTGFDLDGIKLSSTLVNSASDAAALAGLDVFSFNPTGTIFTPGSQRSPIDPADLFGTVGTNIDNGVASLENFDGNSTTGPTANGFASLGEIGKVGFNLTSPVSTADPLYLYIGEVGDNGELAGGAITASNRLINELNDLSTDFGFPGVDGDTITFDIAFDADPTAEQLFFQFAFGSEELLEYSGSQFNDAFSLELNGFNMARLSDGQTVAINTLAVNPVGPYHPDLIYNPVDTGPASGQTRLDGYTPTLTFAGPINPGDRNTLRIRIRDVRDGLLDSAVFLKSGTLGTVDPRSPSPSPTGSPSPSPTDSPSPSPTGSPSPSPTGSPSPSPTGSPSPSPTGSPSPSPTGSPSPSPTGSPSPSPTGSPSPSPTGSPSPSPTGSPSPSPTGSPSPSPSPTPSDGHTSIPEPGNVLGLLTLGALGIGVRLRRSPRHTSADRSEPK